VDRSLFKDEFLRLGASVLRHDTWRYFRDLEGEWPSVTDQIYLFGRMQRWAGAAYSQWRPDHAVLAPFFHPVYVEWASRIPDRLKRSSRSFVALLNRLDPGLAHRPLDSGLRPVDLCSRTLGGRLRLLRRDAKRATRKVKQRLGGTRHAPAGADLLASSVLRHWQTTPPTDLARVPWIDQGAVERLLEGRAPADAVTVAYLLNMDGASAMLAGRQTH
jgi:asparagine synthase (glutamine-hydrolysing)